MGFLPKRPYHPAVVDSQGFGFNVPVHGLTNTNPALVTGFSLALLSVITLEPARFGSVSSLKAAQPDSSSPPLLRSDDAVATNQQRVRPRRACNLLALVANDRCDAQLEVLGRFDWSLLFHRATIML